MASWYRGYYEDWPSAPTVAERAASAAKKAKELEKKGKKLSPVVLEGRKIAATFWGKAWCENLEGYSDYENRLPRGRSYVRSGSVIDLAIEAGRVKAMVQGSRLYTVTIDVRPVAMDRWKKISASCAGQIDSMVELLQGKLSSAVMDRIARRDEGLFPSPKEITLACSCPDWASMCKHVAAVLYGVGARLDRAPELLFVLRGADAAELVATAAKGSALRGGTVAKEKRLGGDLGSLFGIELDEGGAAPKAVAAPKGKVVAAPEVKIRAAPKAKAAPKPKAARAPAEAPKVITGEELAYFGVPPATVHYWLKTGVLGRTDQRGVYVETAASRERLDRRIAGR
jgi:uncharacterized Zn finger protein